MLMGDIEPRYSRGTVTHVQARRLRDLLPEAAQAWCGGAPS